jgi:hypothetical protein
VQGILPVGEYVPGWHKGEVQNVAPTLDVWPWGHCVQGILPVGEYVPGWHNGCWTGVKKAVLIISPWILLYSSKLRAVTAALIKLLFEINIELYASRCSGAQTENSLRSIIEIIMSVPMELEVKTNPDTRRYIIIPRTTSKIMMVSTWLFII